MYRCMYVCVDLYMCMNMIVSCMSIHEHIMRLFVLYDNEQRCRLCVLYDNEQRCEDTVSVKLCYLD